MKPYIIGETAFNHEGDIDYLYRMIDDIVQLKLNAIKFHMILDIESYITVEHPLRKDIQKWLFSREEWDEIFKLARQQGLDIIVLGNDIASIKYIIEHHPYIAGIELHASSLNDYYLLDEVVDFPGQVVLGIGGSGIDEINEAIEFLRKKGKEEILLMYGFQAYPTDYRNINFAKMLKIKEMFNLPLGYADHTSFDDENNVQISALPAAMGINILEKHYTPDLGVERIDYQAAVSKKHFLQIKHLMEIYLSVYGNGNLSLSDQERDYGKTGPMKKAIVARQFIKKGEDLNLQNLTFKRTAVESAIKQSQFFSLIGLKTRKNINKNEIIDFSKIEYPHITVEEE